MANRKCRALSAKWRTILTASEIKYLISIYQLEQATGKVRQSELAKALECSGPSVTRATDKLEFLGCIKKGSALSVTDKGRAAAEKLLKIREGIEKFLIADLGSPPRAAKKDSLAIIGVISNCNLENIYNKIDR